MKQQKVVTFGEIMLRLSTPGYQRFGQASQFEVNYGGGEANVAVSLAQFGLDAVFVSRLPQNEIGQAAVNELRRYGVKTEYILQGGSRIGIYFLESGASQRPSRVIYDRAHSAVSGIKPGMVNWNDAFSGASWFHITGITPALSPETAEASLEAVIAASELSVTVSCDLNYRKKLWTREEAGRAMEKIVKHVDVLIANEEDADMVFGIKAGESDVATGTLEAGKYQSVAEQLMQRFPKIKKVAITLRESISAFDNIWSAVLWDGTSFHQSRKYPVHIVDRVGGGDSFCAGLIYGLLTGRSNQDALEFAAAASCLKHSIHGDFNLTTAAEVDSLIKSGGSGRIVR